MAFWQSTKARFVEPARICCYDNRKITLFSEPLNLCLIYGRDFNQNY